MGKSKKILLVEDNPINQDMLSRRLLRRGYEVVLANNGAEGCSMAISEKPDLILMDMSLPVMDGWEATRRLKADEQTSFIPIIALTAHAMVGDLDKVMEAGCDEYHTKPIELPKLLKKMEFFLTQELVKPSEKQEIITSQSIKLSNKSNSQTLLIVDDNEMNRDMLSRRLERGGYKILIAVNGEQALEIVAQQAVDLVLLDIMMPGLSGLETLKRLRETFSQAQLPILMATAKDESRDIVRAFELVANDYITKPIDFPIALARIQSPLNTLTAVRQESTTEKPPAQIQTEKPSANLVESPKSLNLDVDKQPSIPFTSPEQGELLDLPEVIKLFYAPMETRLWRTGTLVKVSATRAEIHSNREIKLLHRSEVQIRLWHQNDLNTPQDISGIFLGMSEQAPENLIIQFITQSPIIESILNQLK